MKARFKYIENFKKGMKKPKINSNLRYFLWTILGIIILGSISVLANNVFTNSPSNYWTADNITTNNTGIYYNSNKAFSRTADVVVCRGTSAVDDLLKSFQCDVVCASTDDDCTAELQSVFSLSNKNILIKKGEYYTSSYLTTNSSLYLLGEKGTTLLANGTESGWTTGLGTRYGIINTFQYSDNDGNVNDLTIENINFTYKDKAIAIGLYGGENIKIKNNIFSGTTNSTNSQGGAISFVGIYANQNLNNLEIIGNSFLDVKPMGGTLGVIYFDSRGKDVYNTLIKENTFKNINGIGIKVTGTTTLTKNFKIDNNDFIEFNDTSTGSGAGKYAEAINLGLSGVNIENVEVINNYYENGFTSHSSSSPEAGFIFIYSGKNFVVDNNIAVVNSSIVDSIAFAPGRTSTPIRGLVISNNIMEGFSRFWDPDSMIDADIHDNIIKNVGGIFPSIGYGTQENVKVHNNIITNYENLRFGNHSDFYAVIELFNSNPINSEISNNIWSNYMDSVIINCGVQIAHTGSTYKHGNVSITGNKVYHNGTITTQLCNNSASNVFPSIIKDNNFLADNYTIIAPDNSLHRYAINNSGALNQEY